MKIIGVDIGGTKISAALVIDGKITKQHSCPTPGDQPVETVINAIKHCIESIFDTEALGIGIGVPGLIDLENNYVINVVNIPKWNKVPLKGILEKSFNKLVVVNNDANCFALGEKHYGKGKFYKNFVGVTLGTGLGAGIVINDRLYSGSYCGAGEFGMMSRLPPASHRNVRCADGPALQCRG